MSYRTIFLVLALWIAPATMAKCQPVSWANSATGLGAGAWSTPSNWSPAIVPTSTNNARITNGGEASITASVAASRIEVGKNNGVGILTSVAPGVELIIDSDFDIGQIGGNFAAGPGRVTGDGSVAISNAARLVVGNGGAGGIDVATTNATAGAEANGTGSLSLQAVASVEVADDANIGQAGGSATSTAHGAFTASSLGMLSIGADFDVGQSGGTGQANGHGTATIENSQLVVGANIDVGRTSGSTVGNFGDGTLHLTDSTASIGFADSLLPKSLNIGDAGAQPGKRANAQGLVTLARSTIDVANRINIGGLSGGGSNLQNSADGTLRLVDSLATAGKVDVAVVSTNTLGSSTGLLQVDASLVDVGGTLALGAGATLHFGLAGVNRSDGSGTAGQYGAINANSALLAGDFEVFLLHGFQPAAGNQFDLIATTGLIAGFIMPTSLPALPVGLDWNVSQTANLLRLDVVAGAPDADFNADGNVDGQDFLIWQRNVGILTGANPAQGDSDFDGDVDQVDLSVWESQFNTMPSPSLAIAATAPEPGTGALAASFALLWWPAMRWSNSRLLVVRREVN